MLGATEPACAASEIRFWKSLGDCPHEARINEIASVIATPAPTCGLASHRRRRRRGRGCRRFVGLLARAAEYSGDEAHHKGKE